jgi:4-hydroxy-tetrahydrodipicolinate reductase
MKKYTAEKKGCFIYASNFSVGVNIFFEVNRKLAELMAHQKDYDVHIEEIHHTQKKDAPSGTAISLAEQVLSSSGQKKHWVNAPVNDPAALVITSRREDPAPGTHTVTYHSMVDDISITHTAHNREGFATGAVIAAEFAKGKSGFFTMKEVLHL